jgi:hypothetical protein
MGVFRSKARYAGGLFVGLAVVLLLIVSEALAARPPTYVERVTIMDAFNKPGSSFASKCVKIVVSSVDPRYAKLTFPYPPPPACAKAGEGPFDGYTLFRRKSRKALHWREILMASELPCFVNRKLLPPAVHSDLFPKSECPP